MPRTVLQWEQEGAGGKGRPKGRWMVGKTRSMSKSRVTEWNTRGRERWRNVVVGEGNQLCNGMNEYVSYYE